MMSSCSMGAQSTGVGVGSGSGGYLNLSTYSHQSFLFLFFLPFPSKVKVVTAKVKVVLPRTSVFGCLCENENVTQLEDEKGEIMEQNLRGNCV